MHSAPSHRIVRKRKTRTATKPSTDLTITPTAYAGAITDTTIGAFSDFPQLSQFWYAPEDVDLSGPTLLDILDSIDSISYPPSKKIKTNSGQTAAEAQTISQLNTDIMKAAFLLAYNTMDTEAATSGSIGDDNQLAALTQIDRIKSSFAALGHGDAVISIIVDGARTLLQYRQLRDRRFKTLEKLEKDLERVTKEIAEISKSYNSAKAWQVPRLTLKDSKAIIVEDDLIGREREQTEKVAEDLETIAALAQEWKKIGVEGGSHSRPEDAT